MSNYTYDHLHVVIRAKIHEDCRVKDEAARGLDTYATIAKPALVPNAIRNPPVIGASSLFGK